MKRRRLLVGVGSTAIASSLVVGSGAFSSVNAERDMTVNVVEDPDAFLGLDRCQDEDGNSYPNGDYVNLSDGLMSIDLSEGNNNILGDGVNAEAVTEINNVFQICNQGTQVSCVSLEFDPVANPETGEDAVKIFREPDRLQVGPDRKDGAFLLEPGTCACFSLLIDTHGISPGDDIAENLFQEVTSDGEELQIIAAAEDSQIYETPPCFSEPEFPQVEHKIYLTNSRDRDEDGDENPGTRLLSVEALDSGSGEAILNHLAWLPEDNFNQVDSMAITPDGETLYFYDKDSRHLGKWDTPVPQNSIVDLGRVDEGPSGIVLGDFMPDDGDFRLLVVSQTDDNLYEIKDYDSNPIAESLGHTGITVGGSDIEWVVGEDQLYIHTNADGMENDLHTVSDIDSGVSTSAVGNVGKNLTGLALGETGSDLIGSVGGYPGGMVPGEVVEFHTSSPSSTTTYEMTLDGEDYNYTSGDMASWIDNGSY